MGKILISIKNTNKIFNGTQPILFLKRKGKNMNAGDTIYFCEPGARYSEEVVGKATIAAIKDVPHVFTATYMFLPYYVSIYGNEEDKKMVEKAMAVQLDDYDNSFVLCYLYQDEVLKYMRENHKPPSVWPPVPCSSEQINVFLRANKKRDALCNSCDAWAKELGFYDKYDQANWNYILELEGAVPFKKPVDIASFSDKDGKPLAKKPRNWRYVK